MSSVCICVCVRVCVCACVRVREINKNISLLIFVDCNELEKSRVKELHW